MSRKSSRFVLFQKLQDRVKIEEGACKVVQVRGQSAMFWVFWVINHKKDPLANPLHEAGRLCTPCGQTNITNLLILYRIPII